MSRKSVEYPRVVYGPYGASMVIQRAEDWPEGWRALPGVAAPPHSATRHAALPRAELKRRLRAAGLLFDENAADTALEKRLADG